MIDTDGFNAILWLVVAIISLIPFTAFMISYRKLKSGKLLITSTAFFLFFIKAVLLAMKLFVNNYAEEVWWSVAALIDILIITLIAYSLARKS